MQEIFAWLLATFVLGPWQADMHERLNAARAAPVAIEQVQACVAEAAPKLAARAAGDWWWGVSTVTAVSVGMTDPLDVVRHAAPSCGKAIDAARPFITAQG